MNGLCPHTKLRRFFCRLLRAAFIGMPGDTNIKNRFVLITTHTLCQFPNLMPLQLRLWSYSSPDESYTA
ncbi:Uncharacterised protein [Salmonella enterica subsp. enterica]|uniref:Uncharacterized protein n=1 Tax=Salmonella enterica I TaxID=59201 RepID=A0A3S4HYM3_SALET|nr:Uncharacterised protein [Salmonella enterica subsp. enterica]